MQPNIAEKRNQIAAICRKYDVRRMDVYDASDVGFGHPEGAPPIEIGFLVTFNGDAEPFEQFGQTLKMEEELNALLQTGVDVADHVVMNPEWEENRRFQETVENRLEPIYG